MEQWKETGGKDESGMAECETEVPKLVLCTVRLDGLMHPLGEPLNDWQVQEGREVRRPLAVPGGIAAATAAGIIAAVAVGRGVIVLVVVFAVLIPQYSFSGGQCDWEKRNKHIL